MTLALLCWLPKEISSNSNICSNSTQAQEKWWNFISQIVNINDLWVIGWFRSGFTYIPFSPWWLNRFSMCDREAAVRAEGRYLSYYWIRISPFGLDKKWKLIIWRVYAYDDKYDVDHLFNHKLSMEYCKVIIPINSVGGLNGNVRDWGRNL